MHSRVKIRVAVLTEIPILDFQRGLRILRPFEYKDQIPKIGYDKWNPENIVFGPYKKISCKLSAKLAKIGILPRSPHYYSIRRIN